MANDNRLTVTQLAERLQVSVNMIYRWNSDGTGPKYMRIGKHVRYRVRDVEAWERSKEADAA